MEFPRLPRFARSRAVTSMQLTSRDHEILRHTLEHRFLRSDQIAALVNGSSQQVVRRLQLLYHHGYLERPRCQIDYYHRYGSRRMVCGLSDRGAAVLKRELKVPFLRTGSENKTVGRLFLEHALLISEVMVALELACRQRNDVRFLSASSLSAKIAQQREPFQWRVRLPQGVDCGVVPDKVFALEFSNRANQKKRIHFCLEADRGTMPVKRASLKQSSIQRKLLAYAATWKQGVHRQRLGWHRFRVLTVTTSRERLASMQAAGRELPHGHGLFLFADVAAFREPLDPFSSFWKTCHDGVTASLLD